jgi:hypothetical protein
MIEDTLTVSTGSRVLPLQGGGKEGVAWRRPLRFDEARTEMPSTLAVMGADPLRSSPLQGEDAPVLPGCGGAFPCV